MTTDKRKTRLEMIRQAKTYSNPERRRWLFVGKAKPYNEDGSEAEVWALEGSPIRGYLIANREEAWRLDDYGKCIHRFYIDDEPEAR